MFPFRGWLYSEWKRHACFFVVLFFLFCSVFSFDRVQRIRPGCDMPQQTETELSNTALYSGLTCWACSGHTSEQSVLKCWARVFFLSALKPWSNIQYFLIQGALTVSTIAVLQVFAYLIPITISKGRYPMILMLHTEIGSEDCQ